MLADDKIIFVSSFDLGQYYTVIDMHLAYKLLFFTAQFENYEQNYGYVTVRPGAHMFYWLFHTTANVANYTERPLIVWLQGGPGGSSTGIGNFDILGPLDLSLQERNYTWVLYYYKYSLYLL